jgi:hypothetical protein
MSASTDQAPGPSMSTLAPITASKAGAGLKPAVAAIIDISSRTSAAAANGVRNPPIRQIANAPPTTSDPTNEVLGTPHNTESVTDDIGMAAVTRNSTRAAPGHELGKVENSRCISATTIGNGSRNQPLLQGFPSQPDGGFTNG